MTSTTMTSSKPSPSRVGPGQAFEAAAALENQGRLSEAERLYQYALALAPNHLGSLLRLSAIQVQHGDLASALRLLQQAAGAAPRSADAQAALGRLLATLNRTQEAIACYRRALEIKPDSAAVHHHLGHALGTLQQRQEAIGHYQRALALDPDRAETHANLATLLAALDRPQEAIIHYERAVAIKPNDVEARCRLGLALQATNRLESAVAEFKRALALAPNAADIHVNLGTALHALGRLQDAVTQYRRAVAISPENAAAHNNLGNALSALDRHQEAIAHYRRALAINPALAETHNNLGTLLGSHNRFDEAIVHYELALAIRPDLAEAHGNLGNALLALNRPAEAAARYETGLAINSELPRLHHARGIALQVLGRLEEAAQAFERAVALAPGKADFHLPLAYARPFTGHDPRLAALEALARDHASLGEEDQIALHFALGKAYVDVGQHQRSFYHLRAGNALKRRRVIYDEDRTLKTFARIRATFSSALMQEKRGAGDPSPLPIFVVGMPRSGTTLVEQILASHSRVFGAGERNDLSAALPGLSMAHEAMVFPEVVSILPAAALRQFGLRYLDRISALAPTAERIIDKMPSNFGLVGLIHLALPGARIIHVRRDPLDTCLSCFSILFVGHQPYTYDLGELGRYYKAYQRTMDHWRAVLPEGVLLEVQYEDVVAGLEGQARRIVAHCGLPWEDACLAFHTARRPVQTASSVQVRQPIYRSAVGRWRPYASELQPLRQALDSSADDR